jgi:cadmium resistance protein CadD (predicted permease)
MQTILTSLLAFIATNIDDIFILMLFFGSRKFKNSSVFIGQHIGMAVLVALSFAGAFIGNFIDQRYIGLLGLFPIYLAVRQLYQLIYNGKDDDDTELPATSGVLAIAGVTIANGGDNVGVYIPLLATMTLSDQVQMIIVFAILTYVWCLLGKYLAAHPLIAKRLDRYGHIVMPIVLFLLGVFILFESRTFGLVGL